MQTYFDSLLKLAADDWASLRKVDVYRIVECCPIADRDNFASVISTMRPDLAVEAAEVLVDLN